LLASGSVHKVVQDNWGHERTSDADAKTNLMIEKGGYLLYSKGVQTEFFTFILDGKAEIFSGRQKFRSDASRFTILCPELLSQTQHDHKEGLEFSAFVPDFTARVTQNSRILRIPRENFIKCLLGKLRNYSRPVKETRDKLREVNRRKMQSEGTFSVRSNYDSSTNAYTSVPMLATLNSNSEVKSSNTVPNLHKTSSRQRFYDETYVGHEHDGQDARKLGQSPRNLTTVLDNDAQLSKNESSDVQVLEVA